MTDLKSTQALYSDFKQSVPLMTLAISANAGTIAAWMDWCAAFCQIPCSLRSVPALDRLAKMIAFDFEASAVNADSVYDALALTAYPFSTAQGVRWPISLTRFFERNQAAQMSGPSKSDLRALEKNTQEHLAWKAEVAARHGGNYKQYIDRLLEPLNGFGRLGTQRTQLIEAGEQIRMMARTNAVNISRR